MKKLLRGNFKLYYSTFFGYSPSQRKRRGMPPGPNGLTAALSPATGEILGTVPILSKKEVNDLVERASRAAEVWSQLSFAKRAEELNAWRRALARRADELAELIHRENGKPLTDAMSEIMLALSHLDHAAKRAPVVLADERVGAGVMANFKATISYFPLGVVGVIGIGQDACW